MVTRSPPITPPQEWQQPAIAATFSPSPFGCEESLSFASYSFGETRRPAPENRPTCKLAAAAAALFAQAAATSAAAVSSVAQKLSTRECESSNRSRKRRSRASKHERKESRGGRQYKKQLKEIMRAHRNERWELEQVHAFKLQHVDMIHSLVGSGSATTGA